VTNNKSEAVWWVEPNHMPGVHKIRVSVWYKPGRTIEVSHLVPQMLLDSVILPDLFIGQIIFRMQYELNEAITVATNSPHF